MNQVTIKSISLEGFRSYSQPTTFKFANTGLHLIKGNNGEGKSSLFSALTWCLFKVNLNNTTEAKIPTWKWLRHKEYKGTRVQVLFGVGKYKYLVARHRDFKGLTKGIDGNDSLLIFKKEKMDKTPITSADIVNDALYKADGQAYLNSLLGIDSKTFLNSVLFGQRMSRLMDSKDADKRELFERLFDSSFIDLAKDKADKQTKEVNAELQQITITLAKYQTKQEQLAGAIDNAETLLADFNETRKVTLENSKGNFDATKEDITEIEGMIRLEEAKPAKDKSSPLDALMQDADARRQVYYDAKDEMTNTLRDINTKKRDIQVYVDKEATLTTQLKEVKLKCLTCGQKLSDVTVLAAKESIRTQIAEAINVQRALNKNLVDLQALDATRQIAHSKALNAYTRANDAYTTAKSSHTVSNDNVLDQLRNKHALLLQQKAQLKQQYEAEKARKAPVVNIEALQAELAAAEAEVPAIEKSIKVKNNLLARLAWWSKAFGSGGLRSFIFSAELNRLNSCLSPYTQYFGIGITFGIDLTKTNKPFYCKVMLDNEHEVDYLELSGGQKQRIDLIINFSIQDVAEGTTCFNISIFDEPEEGLDAEALEVLDTLLRLRAERKAIYIISHYQLLDLSGAIIYDISGGKTGQSIIN
jgi:DNA repair exonuclease SbcCD ATPase subunit